MFPDKTKVTANITKNMINEKSINSGIDPFTPSKKR